MGDIKTRKEEIRECTTACGNAHARELAVCVKSTLLLPCAEVCVCVCARMLGRRALKGL